MTEITDVADAVLADQRQARVAAFGALEDKPDDAARAQQLSLETGVPASVIHGDLENFERIHKAHLNRQIIDRNPILQEYINSEPMAAKVSHDDFHNLDEATDLVKQLQPGRMGGIFAKSPEEIKQKREEFEAFLEGSGKFRLPWQQPEWFRPEDKEFANKHPYLSLLVSGGSYGLETALKGLSGFGHMIPKMFENQLTNAGWAEDDARRYANTLGGFIEWKLTDMAAHGIKPHVGEAVGGLRAPEFTPEKILPELEKISEAVEAARPWLESGQPIPRGVHEYWDKEIERTSKDDLKQLDDAFKSVAKTKTRERSPELTAGLIKQIVGDGKIEISAEAVRKLYGEDIPEPEDGKLGWIPNLRQQLETAEATGGSVEVPLSEWLARAEPEIAKTLRDDIRVRPQGMTLREAEELKEQREAKAKEKEERFEPEGEPPSEDAVQATRRVAGVEKPAFEGPLFAEESEGWQQGEGDKWFPLLPETAEKGGEVSHNIGTGPITVPRIAGTKLSDLLDKIHFEFMDEGTKLLNEFFGNRLKELVGDTPVHIVSEADMAKLLAGKDLKGGTAPGFYGPLNNQIVLTEHMVNGDYPPWYTSRVIIHEAEHALSSIALMKYSVLDAAVKMVMRDADEHISGKDAKARKAFDYAFQNSREFFADVKSRPALQKWLAQAPASKETITAVQRIGDALGLKDRIVSTWDAIRVIFKDLYNRMFGRVPDNSVLDQVFKLSDILENVNKTLEGMAKEQGVSKGDLLLRAESPNLVEGDKPTFGKMAIGMNKRWQEKYFKLIEKRNAEDMEKQFKDAERDERKRQTEEWKSNATKMRQEVSTDLEGRPDIAIGTFFESGTLFGQKVSGRPILDASKLSEEQKAILPKATYGRAGINPDDLAGAFGLRSGDELVQILAQIQQARGEVPFKEYVRQITDKEVSRRMLREYGDPEENIMNEAIEHVIGSTQMDILHEDLVGLGMQLNRTLPFTKEDTKAFAKAKFDATPVGQVTIEKMLRDAGKAGTDSELAHLDGKIEEAFKAKQKQYLSMRMAEEAKKFEKKERQFEKTLKRASSRVIPGVEPEYTDFIHEIMLKIGRTVKRSVQDIARSKELNGTTDLQSFVQSKENSTFGLRTIPVADFLFDENYKKLTDDMTVQEYLGVKDSIDALIHNGRDEAKIIGEGIRGDRAVVLKEMVDKLRTFPLKDYPATKGLGAKVTNIPKTYLAASTSIETLLNRFDRNDPYGVFNKYLVYRLAESANHKEVLIREFSKVYQEALGDIRDINKLMESPFNDPLKKTAEFPNGQPWTGFTRRNGLMILQNMGNEQNWNVLVKGFSRSLGTEIDPVALREWVFRNFTKEDFDRAQRIGDMFDKAFKLVETTDHNVSGVAPERIPLQSIQTPHGLYRGWYHPLIKDPLREGFSEKQRGGNVYDDDYYGHVSLANSFTKRRTGAAYPLSLEWDMIPIRLQQILHYVSFRESILEAQKVFNDRGFREAVTAHYGEHYTDGLMPYLRGVAGMESIDSRGAALAARVSNFLRANVISTYIGFNPYTALKHGPTALVLSMKEVGPVNFIKAGSELYSKSPDIGLSNKEFVDKNSEEVGRRARHWDETIVGQHKDILGPGTTREQIMQAGSWLVAQSDMISVRPTWLAAYEKAVHEIYERDGETNHGLAVAIANRAVRRAHGSTAITNLPALVARGGPLHSWLVTLYGFFGTMMQRRIEIAHQLNDTYQLGKDKEFRQAAANLPGIAASVLAYIVWPTIVEEYVTGLTTDDRRGWGAHIVSGTFLGLASSMLYLRDMVHSFVTGHEPGVGLISSPLHDIKNVATDIGKGTKALNKQHAGKTVGDTLTVFGEATGMAPRTIASATRFGIDVATGQQRPKTFKDWRMGITRGTMKERVQK